MMLLLGQLKILLVKKFTYRYFHIALHLGINYVHTKTLYLFQVRTTALTTILNTTTATTTLTTPGGMNRIINLFIHAHLNNLQSLQDLFNANIIFSQPVVLS